jgi:hypothetical protein
MSNHNYNMFYTALKFITRSGLLTFVVTGSASTVSRMAIRDEMLFGWRDSEQEGE